MFLVELTFRLMARLNNNVNFNNILFLAIISRMSGLAIVKNVISHCLVFFKKPYVNFELTIDKV